MSPAPNIIQPIPATFDEVLGAIANFLYMFTFGLFGFGTLIDFIRICTGDFTTKDGQFMPWSNHPAAPAVASETK